MRNLPPNVDQQAHLRLDAENRLRKGLAPRTHGWTVGTDTLALLYRLASAPDTAADALKLLSELQTHQVELDLQHAQFEADQQELAQALGHYRDLYDFAPVAYLVVGLDGQVLQGNRAGVELFGMGLGPLAGQPVTSLFAHESRLAVPGLLTACREGSLGVSCAAVSSDQSGGPPDPLRITASPAPGGEAALMVVTRCERSPQ